MRREDLSKVYRIPLNDQYSREKSIFSLECTLTHRIFRLLDIFTENDIVGIKLNDAIPDKDKKIPPEYYKMIATLLFNKNVSSVLCDTSHKYKDRIVNAAKYMHQIFKNGFSYLDTGIPFMMLDGANGKHETVIRVDQNSERNNLYFAGEINNLSGLIVTSLPRPHSLAGFKGALFNLGFGMASRRGKIKFSSMNPPQINSSRCYFCRKCLHECPTNAIYVNDRHVEINPDLCFDCGKCVDIAQYGGISYSWNATPEYFQDTILKYSESIFNTYRGKLLFINFIPDFSSSESTIFNEILVSKDPYAIDSETAKRIMTNGLLKLDKVKYKLETINY